MRQYTHPHDINTLNFLYVAVIILPSDKNLIVIFNFDHTSNSTATFRLHLLPPLLPLTAGCHLRE